MPASPASPHFHRLLIAASACALCAGAFADPPSVDRTTTLVTGPTMLGTDCNGAPQTGTLYSNAEVEPFVAANPRNRLNLVGVWQQDRWSNGGAQGLGTGVSFDGGQTWTRFNLRFTRCAGGNATNGGDYERGSDPWVSFSPNGVAHQMVLTVNFAATPTQTGTAMLASRSLDGGRTWGATQTLVTNTPERFNDKNSLTADPTDARYVYAVWDRLSSVPGEGAGPTLLARSTNNGQSYESARVIYDPGPDAQTIGNRIEVLPDGTLINLFTQIDYSAGLVTLRVIRSSDKGQTWSPPILVSELLANGAYDPQTRHPIRDGAILGQLAVAPSGVISVVWQDARFSGGTMDGIVLSQSLDGGSSWSAPVQVNRDPRVQAFTPSIHVRADGTVGVSYHDLRSDTASPDTLLTDTWLTRSRDGLKWQEGRVSDPFDLARAPDAGGYFVGDYQGLTSIGPVFVPFFARSGGPDANRNDIYAHTLRGKALPAAAADAAGLQAEVAAEEAALPLLNVQGTGRSSDQLPAAMRSALRERTWQAFERLMRTRIPNWDAWPMAQKIARKPAR